MIIANHKLNALDALFTVIEQIERYDYIAVGERIINIAATTAAIIIGVATYVITALQLFWLQHGESIMVDAFRIIVNLVDYTHELYQFGAETRRFIAKTLNYCMDRAYYSAIA